MPHFSPSPTRMTTTCKGHGARNGPVGIADAETARMLRRLRFAMHAACGLVGESRGTESLATGYRIGYAAFPYLGEHNFSSSKRWFIQNVEL